VPNNRTEALLRALANALPAEDDPVLVFLSRTNGGVDGDMGILTAEDGDLDSLLFSTGVVLIGIDVVRGEASNSICIKKKKKKIVKNKYILTI
jgi:hypothetical protein